MFGAVRGEKESSGGSAKLTGATHLGLDHVDSPGAERLHAVVDVHHAFALRHIQHDVQHDVAAGPARAHAAAGEEENPLASVAKAGVAFPLPAARAPSARRYLE